MGGKRGGGGWRWRGRGSQVGQLKWGPGLVFGKLDETSPIVSQITYKKTYSETLT